MNYTYESRHLRAYPFCIKVTSWGYVESIAQQWCMKNLGDRYNIDCNWTNDIIGGEWWYFFKEETDFVLFKLSCLNNA